MGNCLSSQRRMLRSMKAFLLEMATSVYGIQLGELFLTFDKFNMMWSGQGQVWKYWPTELTLDYNIQTFRAQDNSLVWAGAGYIFIRKNASEKDGAHDMGELCRQLDAMVRHMMPVCFKGRISILIYGENAPRCFLVQNGQVFTKKNLSSHDIFQVIQDHRLAAIIPGEDNDDD